MGWRLRAKVSWRLTFWKFEQVAVEVVVEVVSVTKWTVQYGSGLR